MNTTLDLNQLILEAVGTHSPQRGEVLLGIERGKKDASAVKVVVENKSGLFDRIFGRDHARVLLVHTGRSVSLLPIELESEDVASEVTYQISLKLDMQTPAAGDTAALRQLGHAFRDATLAQPGKAATGSPVDTPSGRLRSELQQWLKSRYRSGKSLARYAEQEWRARENQQIAEHIRTEYGLDTRAKLRVYVPRNQRLRVSTDVKTTARDSAKDLVFTVTLGCKLTHGDVFSAPSLTAEDLEARIAEQTDLFVRQNVTLQEFRFEPDWTEALKSHLERDLARYDRSITEFQVPLAQNELYSRGPHETHAGDAVFQPAGWNGEDVIRFSSEAKMFIADAARFEAGRSHSELLRTKEQLDHWLKVELQEAVSEELHEIHDDERGYAALLGQWEGEDGYRKRIENNLAKRAGRQGLNAEAIIAKPDRDELKLLTGAEIMLDELQLPCLEPGATLDFDATVRIRIKQFGDIKDLLNRTHKPLESLRNDVVHKILSHAARKIPYLQFYQHFESGPWPAADEGVSNAKAEWLESEGGHAQETGCVGWLTSELRWELQDEHNIELVSFTARQTSTEFYEIFMGLQKTVPQAVRFTLDSRAPRIDGAHTAHGVTDKYEISFILDIAGLDQKNIRKFFRDWSDFRGQQTGYEAVRSEVEEKLPSYFSVEDRMRFRTGEQIGDKIRDSMRRLVVDRLNLFLAENFGLTGYAHGVDVVNKGAAIGPIKEKEARDLIAVKTVEAQTEATLAKIETDKIAFVEAEKRIAADLVEDAVDDHDRSLKDLLAGPTRILGQNVLPEFPLDDEDGGEDSEESDRKDDDTRD